MVATAEYEAIYQEAFQRALDEGVQKALEQVVDDHGLEAVIDLAEDVIACHQHLALSLQEYFSRLRRPDTVRRLEANMRSASARALERWRALYPEIEGAQLWCRAPEVRDEEWLVWCGPFIDDGTEVEGVGETYLDAVMMLATNLWMAEQRRDRDDTEQSEAGGQG